MSKTILPTNHSDLEKAVDITIDSRFDFDIPIGNFWSAENCPEPFLPCLAWALSVDVWRDSWSARVKRQVIAASVEIHRTKGTAVGMRKALAALDLGVRIAEWFETGGEPFTFEASVLISNQSLTRGGIADIIEIIKTTKNARSHLTGLKLFLVNKSESYVAAALVTGQSATLLPYQPKIAPAFMSDKYGAAVTAYQKITIGAA